MAFGFGGRLLSGIWGVAMCLSLMIALERPKAYALGGYGQVWAVLLTFYGVISFSL